MLRLFSYKLAAPSALDPYLTSYSYSRKAWAYLKLEVPSSPTLAKRPPEHHA